MPKASKRASAQKVSPVLKCRKGDLALYIAGKRVGRIVEVVKFYPIVEMSNGEVMVDAWMVRHPDHAPDTEYFQRDKYMMPIRPGDLEDTEDDELVRKEGDTQEVQHG